jgi:hypothetical protein
MNIDRLHDELLTLIGRVRRRWTAFVRLRALARGAFGAAAVLAVTAAVDRDLRAEGLFFVFGPARGTDDQACLRQADAQASE